jgi:hypothetical protein
MSPEWIAVSFAVFCVALLLRFTNIASNVDIHVPPPPRLPEWPPRPKPQLSTSRPPKKDARLKLV